MTGQLRGSLHTRADELDTWDVDLDTIVRAGDRRLRRRRIAVAGTVAAVLAVAGGVTVAARSHATRPQPADQDAKPLTYAVGRVIHSGDNQVDVGMRVDSFVRLTDRFVFSHDQHVYEAKDGDVHEIDRLADPSAPLVAGEDGQQSEWFGHSDTYGVGLMIYPGYPQVGGRPNASFAGYADTWDADSPPRILAASGRYLWVTNGSRVKVVLHDPPDGPYEFWPIPSTGPSMIQDAAGDSLLVRVDGGLAVMNANLPPNFDQLPGWNTSRNLIPDAPQVPDVDTGDLAPDARHWFTAEGSRFTVYSASDGSAQEPEHPGFADATPYQWLSSDTIAALAHTSGDPDGPVSILTCRVSTNACASALTDAGPAAEVVVPEGPTTR